MDFESQDEADLWSDVNNPNNDADMDDWADAQLIASCMIQRFQCPDSLKA